MIYYFRAALLLFFLFTSSLALAQSNFYKMGGEVGLGVNYLFADGDRDKQKFSSQGHLAFEYNFMRFISMGARAQFGQSQGTYFRGTAPDKIIYNDHFKNGYSNYQVYAKANLGIFIPKFDLQRPFWKYTHGLYAGLGIGGQRNNLTETDKTGALVKDKDKSHAIFIPFIFGYDYFLKNKENRTQWAVSLNYQLIIGLDDELDGGFRGNTGSHNDFNTSLSVGLRYYFGSFGIDKNR